MKTRLPYAKVAPTTLSAYLENRGWSRVGVDERVAIWRRDEHDIMAPMTSDLDDYEEMVAGAVDKIARTFRSKTTEIIQDLLAVAYDIVELKELCGIDDLGTIPMQVASEAVQSLQRLALGVAYATSMEREPKAVVPSKRPADVTEYVGSVNFGQLKNGSTAYALFSPIALVRQMSFWEVDASSADSLPDPFSRRVTARIPQSISAATNAALEANAGMGLQVFADAVEDGVTIPLLRAMRQLIRLLPRDLPIEILYSPLLPGGNRSMNVPLIAEDAAEIFKDAIIYLEAREPADVDDVQGQVVSLGRDLDDVQGAISMVVVLNRKPQRIYIRLPEDDYQTAILAHSRRVNVTVEGRLRREHRRLWLDDPKAFRITDDDDATLDIQDDSV